MEFYRFDKMTGKPITKFNSDFVLSRIIKTNTHAHIGCMYLEKDGHVGYHQAGLPQLLLIVGGSGWVRGEGETKYLVNEGDIVFWESGEWHETTSDNGLTAIIIESEAISSSTLLLEKKEIC